MEPNVRLMETYLARESVFKQKWVDFLQRQDLRITSERYYPLLTPLQGSSLFADTTPEERLLAYKKNIEFISTMQIFLEKTLVHAFYFYRRKEEHLDPLIKRSMRLVAREELYHTQAYEHFLAQQESPTSFMQNRLFRFLSGLSLKINPLAFTLIGAKFEAFSMTHMDDLKSSNMDPQDPWFVLNQMHMEDEAYHVPLQFDIYNASVRQYGFLRTFIAMAIMFVLFQFVLISGMRKVVNVAYANRSFWRRNFILLPATIRWSSRKMQALRKARVMMKRYMKIKKPRYQRVLRFLYT